MMNKDKHKRTILDADKRLIELLKQGPQAKPWGAEETCVEEVEDLRESITLFDHHRMLRLVRAALEIEEWPFRR